MKINVRIPNKTYTIQLSQAENVNLMVRGRFYWKDIDFHLTFVYVLYVEMYL